MFVENIKKQGVVHVHLITNIIKEVYHVNRSELKILKEFCRVIVFVAPNRDIRRFSSWSLKDEVRTPMDVKISLFVVIITSIKFSTSISCHHGCQRELIISPL